MQLFHHSRLFSFLVSFFITINHCIISFDSYFKFIFLYQYQMLSGLFIKYILCPLLIPYDVSHELNCGITYVNFQTSRQLPKKLWVILSHFVNSRYFANSSNKIIVGRERGQKRCQTAPSYSFMFRCMDCFITTANV